MLASKAQKKAKFVWETFIKFSQNFNLMAKNLGDAKFIQSKQTSLEMRRELNCARSILFCAFLVNALLVELIKCALAGGF
jgi:hypothetical protein